MFPLHLFIVRNFFRNSETLGTRSVLLQEPVQDLCKFIFVSSTEPLAMISLVFIPIVFFNTGTFLGTQDWIFFAGTLFRISGT